MRTTSGSSLSRSKQSHGISSSVHERMPPPFGGPSSLFIHHRARSLPRPVRRGSAADFGERLELGAGDALLAFEMAQFRREPLAVGAGRAAEMVAQARQIAL